MIRKLALVCAVAGAMICFPAAAPGDTLTPDQQLAADQLDVDMSVARYGQPGDGGFSYTYTDPDQVSFACATAVSPLDCTAQEGAASAAADLSADSTSAETLSPDTAVVTSSVYDSPSVLDASVSSSTSTTSSSSDAASGAFSDGATSGTTVSSASVYDASASLDPLVTDTSTSVDMAATEVAVTVRSMERGFNSRQIVDYVGQTDPGPNGVPVDRVDNSVGKVAATGIKVHRLFVLWWDVQCNGPSTWSFARYDRVVSAFQARNIRVILTPVGSPNWARVSTRQTPTQAGNPCKNTDARGTGPYAHPDNYRAWSAFIKQLALHYKGVAAIGYEIWNEENSRDFWDNVGNGRAATAIDPVSPSLWARLYCSAVTQIDANDPGRLVGVGGLAVHMTNKFVSGVLENERSDAFLQAAYKARQRRCPNTSTHSFSFDFVGYHPYAYSSYYNGANPAMGNTPAMVMLDRTWPSNFHENGLPPTFTNWPHTGVEVPSWNWKPARFRMSPELPQAVTIGPWGPMVASKATSGGVDQPSNDAMPICGPARPP